MQTIFESLKEYYYNSEMWGTFFLIFIKIVIIMIASRIVIKVANKSILHITREKEKEATIRFDDRRSKTISKLIQSIIKHTVNFITLLLILSQMGFELMPLLAGAGVVGLAIGFGAQNLVKDIITGFFIIFEDQFAVGDVIQTNGVKGTVDEIGLRTTVIKTWTGEVHIIPNGSIDKVTNFSLYNSMAVVDISIAYEEDIDQAVRVLKQTADQLFDKNENMVKEPNVLGVQTLGDSDVVLRVTAECLPNTHFAVGRQLNENIKKAFDAQNIEIPYPRLVTYHRPEKAES